MSQYSNPKWWTKENDSGWERVKAAFKRDWDQTKHDMGGNSPETNQNISDTVKQASGKESIPPRGEPVYEKAEPAYRFGYGARSYYGKKYSAWNAELEKELRRDWAETHAGDWDSQVGYIRSGWEYEDYPWFPDHKFWFPGRNILLAGWRHCHYNYGNNMRLKSGILMALCGTSLLAFSLQAEPPREEIAHAYRLLMVANADCDGHRGKAMEALRRAGHALELDLKGNAPSGEPQRKSDEQLREADRLLHDARNQLESKDRERAAEHVDLAIQEIEIALKGPASVPAPLAEGPREELVHAYRLLLLAKAGPENSHRAVAIEAVRRAGAALGLVLEGTTSPAAERQWKFDQQLSEARRLLHDAKGKMEVRDRELVAAHMDRAIEQIDMALKVR